MGIAFIDGIRPLCIKRISKRRGAGNQLGVGAGLDCVTPMLPSIDAPATRPPPFQVDSAASLRICARNRSRNRRATAEFEAMFEKISAGLRAWQVAQHRSTQFLEAFKEVE